MSAAKAKAKAILNGVVGDYLEASENELAIEMGFYSNEKPLDLSGRFGDDEEGVDAPQRLDSKISVLVHGLTDNESAWAFDDDDKAGGDYGSFLQRDFDMSPFYLRYNTGLHISTNGRKLNSLMNALLASYATDVSEIIFLCHSMGGLVTRSALHYGFEEKSPWVRKVTTVVFLGTPHQGSPWEKLGNVVSNALGSVPRPYMRLAEETANLRSAGIKDLRYGYVLDDDWQNEGDPDSFLNNTKKRAQLLDCISYHTVTGTVTKNPRHPLSLVIGDSLVRKHSAEGRSDNEDHHLNFPSESFSEFAGIAHCGLAKDPDIYKQIKAWVDQRCRQKPPTEQEEEDDDVDSSHEDSTAGLDHHHDEHFIAQKENGKWAQGKGIASLVQDVVGNGATAVEGVHMALTDETFYILSKITPIYPAVKSVKAVHDVTVGGVYWMIRAVSYGVSEVAKNTCDKMDQKQQLQEQQNL